MHSRIPTAEVPAPAAGAAGLGLGANTTMKPSSESPASARLTASLSSALPLYSSLSELFSRLRSAHTRSFTSWTSDVLSNSRLKVSPETVLKVSFIFIKFSNSDRAEILSLCEVPTGDRVYMLC